MDFRSKVVSSILTINVSVIAQATIQLEQTLTGMAQWERAGLITPRSLVRVQFPVFIIPRVYQNPPRCLTQPLVAPLAQRQSTQAHNLGVTRSKRVGGTITFLCGLAGPGTALPTPLNVVFVRVQHITLRRTGR